MQSNIYLTQFRSRSVLPTEIGRTAANYYIRHETAALYLKELEEGIDEQGILSLLAESKEFENIRARKEEIGELKSIQENAHLVPVQSGEELETSAKVLLLIEAYLYQEQLTAFSLIADTNYVMQNVVRLMRGMFEIAMRKKYPLTALNCLQWSIRLDKRMPMESSFARQFSYSANVNPMNYHRLALNVGYIKEEVLKKMEDDPDLFTVQSILEEDKAILKKKLVAHQYVIFIYMNSMTT